MCLDMRGNQNPGNYLLGNFSGIPTGFQAEANPPNLSGLQSVNSGTFFLFGPITFVLPGTPCP